MQPTQCFIIGGSEIYLSIGTIYLYVLFIPCHSRVHLNYIVNMQTIWNFCFMVLMCVLYMMAYLHTYFFSPSLWSMLWLFHVMMIWTYQMKEYVLMQQASNEPQCSIDDLFVFFYCMKNVDLGWVFFGGAISPELLVKYDCPNSCSFINLDQMKCHAMMTEVYLALREWPAALSELFWKGKWDTPGGKGYCFFPRQPH